MSRTDTGDGDGPEYENAYELWQWNLSRALAGKRGQKALADLKAALLALPGKRLIANALNTATVDLTRLESWRIGEMTDLLAEQGKGVCAIGAYAWYRRVQAGADPQKALESLPELDHFSSDPEQTVQIGVEAGLTRTVAWHLASLNDDSYSGLTPEQRYDAVLSWIGQHLIGV